LGNTNCVLRSGDQFNVSGTTKTVRPRDARLFTSAIAK